MTKPSATASQTTSASSPAKPAMPKSPGRPKGAKGKTTIFKEAMQQGFEAKLKTDFSKVLDAVVDRAIKGDMKAAKMLMDRVVPVSKAIDLDDLSKAKGLTIQISVGGMEDKPAPKVIEGEVING